MQFKKDTRNIYIYIYDNHINFIGQCGLLLTYDENCTTLE